MDEDSTSSKGAPVQRVRKVNAGDSLSTRQTSRSNPPNAAPGVRVVSARADRDPNSSPHSSGVRVVSARAETSFTPGVAVNAPFSPGIHPAVDSKNSETSVQSYYAPLTHEPVVARSAVSVSDEFPLSGDSVAPSCFQKLKLLGRGAVGQVYLVMLKENKKLYAMKVLTKEEMVRRNRVKRVITEREILATVNHPFIVTMYASFQTPSRLCFVMEFCEGGEFFRVLQNVPKRRLPEDAARFYAAEVLLALEYLHHMGFVYRDLKPENILMRANGHIALTDFDLSKQAQAVSPRVVTKQLSLMERMKGSLALKRSESGSKLQIMDIIDSEPRMMSQTTSFVGTEEYIAPEVVKGTAQSASVDWWTLGILIFEMMTGTTPFKGKNADHTYKNITNNEIQWPHGIEISHDAKIIMKKLLRREPDKRLGAESGASEIKREKWFAHMNFQLIRNETPPILPRFRDPYDMSQYAVHSDNEDVDDDLYLDVGATLSKRAHADAAPLSARAEGPLDIEAEELTLLMNAHSKLDEAVSPELAAHPAPPSKQLVHVQDLLEGAVRDEPAPRSAVEHGNEDQAAQVKPDTTENPFSEFDTVRSGAAIARKY
uniref:non-specific serine/threonine protein kinase n=1 Tax=Timspurckia oligopyrenoides TaxID=708627 RepID=A0A7S0ZD54_9RHOD|mmetsp:Transcript_13203/g.23725  ORF Transcript_13203/g.23725 Transcript_13203/m.23725 type:complete len:600 (+) Transcript_13203:155-1954(+)|eukprot:CAMPEP_0182444938 /NCGR_PEP_ID=MMETSP1172-20130603/3234_1 /TAXON_ID=708627 /ORGANISM="Timspurckia oligopyrenoides, Strain CCMP3278" /LENGTH=599 /DNA_ID=CAMNT_0024640611 /DNA_START=110 /DNA_END=1909 /DNA_ORIENTATION=-